MAKKKSTWIYLLKRLFVSETNSRLETDKRRRRRCVFGFLTKRRLASLSAASSPTDRRVSETAVTATDHAASSDAVFPGTQVAGEKVVCGSCNSQSADQFKEANGELLANNVDDHVVQSDIRTKEIQVLAAIKIQTAFRAYIARKALRALKGLVRLQAIIRGRAIRRQAITTLKYLQTIVNIQSEVCAKRCEMVKSTSDCQENKLVDLREKDIKIDVNSQRRWDYSPLSKEEANAICMSKREAEIKRERIKEYWSSHRRSAESDQTRVAARRRYWLEQWVDTQLAKRDDFHNSNAVNSAKARIRDQLGSRQLNFRKFPKEHQTDGLDSPLYIPRRSFHRKQHSSGDDSSFAESPSVPTYMAATESAKAKTRSMSSPRLRPINLDAYSEINSPYKHKHKLSPISSINSEATSICRIVNPTGVSQRSPCLKGLPGPIKSKRSLKDFSLNSDVSMPAWDRHGGYRLYI